MNKIYFLSLFLIGVFSLPIQSSSKTKPSKKDKITVACYYFPDYHTGDARITKMKGADWSEWKLVKEAIPRYEGHQQPKVPLWGYGDEKDPKVMAQKIAAASSAGITSFIFDWYYYNDGPFLNRCLDEGFLRAKNRNKIHFSLMWANHDWLELHPATRGKKQDLLFPGIVTPATFEKIGDLLIKKYFSQPNYWKINGEPYFSVYDLQNFVASFGSVEATKAAMNRLRAKARKAGLKGVHWNLVTWGQPVLPSEKVPRNTSELIKLLGFDSATSYVWIHHVPLNSAQCDYNDIRDQYLKFWDKAKAEYSVPYYPNVSMGWDSSPRCNVHDQWGNWGYPFTNFIVNNTPENFKKALEITKKRLLAVPGGPRIITINCWNEWTEGSYLEPDTVHGMAYLNAVKWCVKN